MPRTTKLDRLAAERASALATVMYAEQAHRAAVAALPETAALAAARLKHEAASVAYIREHERTKRRAEIRTEYVVRDIDAHGDAVDSFVFSSWDDAKAFAIRRSAPAVAIDRERDGNSKTVWRSGDADALAAWEGSAPA